MAPRRTPRQRAAALIALAARQHGLFTAAQARDAGFSQDAVKYRIRAGTWIAVDYGVYAIPGAPESWQRRLLAACLGGPAVASHRSAAALWGLPSFGRSSIEVTALRHRRRYSSDVIWHESSLLGDRDTTEIDGIPTTDITRTIIDLAGVCDDAVFTGALDDAVRRSLTSITGVQWRLEQLGDRRKGNARVRKLLARRTREVTMPESILESRFDVLVVASGLPEPIRQYEIRDARGSVVARVDFAYPDACLAIEVDGMRFHSPPSDWHADLARQNRIASLGWLVLRFTAADLELRPREVVSAIRRALVIEMRS